MNRTMTFIESTKNKTKKERRNIDKKWRDEGTAIIRNAFRNLNSDFSKWHQSACESLIDLYKKDSKLNNRETEACYGLTYGQAQKLLNMTLKYLWLLNRVGLLGSTQINKVETNSKKHFPF